MKDSDYLVGLHQVRPYKCSKCQCIIEADWLDFKNHEDKCKS